jgi:flagellar hook protein FlgE
MISGGHDIFSTAVSGLNAAGTIVNKAAANIARAGLDDPGQQAPAADIDLAGEVVHLRLGAILYSANAAVVRVADRMTGTLLDILDSHHPS